MQVRMTVKSDHATLDGLLERSSRMAPAMASIAEVHRSSVVRNFEVGGRYSKAGSLAGGDSRWKPVAGNPTPLVRSGMLRDSIYARHTATEAVVATGLEYAAIHNNGGEARSYARTELFTRNRAGKGSNESHPNLNPFAKGTSAGRGQTYGDSVRNMPARPFMVAQDRDIAEDKRIIRSYLLTGGVR